MHPEKVEDSLERGTSRLGDSTSFFNGINGGALDGIEEFHFVVSQASERTAVEKGVLNGEDVSVHGDLGGKFANISAEIAGRVDGVRRKGGSGLRFSECKETFYSLERDFSKTDRADPNRLVEMDLSDETEIRVNVGSGPLDVQRCPVSRLDVRREERDKGALPSREAGGAVGSFVTEGLALLRRGGAGEVPPEGVTSEGDGSAASRGGEKA